MSKLDELVSELCPDGVIYKTVGDVCGLITDYVAAGSFAEVVRKNLCKVRSPGIHNQRATGTLSPK